MIKERYCKVWKAITFNVPYLYYNLTNIVSLFLFTKDTEVDVVSIRAIDTHNIGSLAPNSLFDSKYIVKNNKDATVFDKLPFEFGRFQKLI